MVDEPVISGECYTVLEVNKRRPSTLADFAGDTEMTLLKNGETRRIVGEGAETAGSVRFHQKDAGPGGKDVRGWTITLRGRDLFLAEPTPTF